MTISTLVNWHQSRQGLLTFGLIEIVLAYILGSLSIDNGSLIVYALTFIIFVGSLNNLYKAVRFKNK